MATKKSSTKRNTNTILIMTGVILLVLTPVIIYLFLGLQDAFCDRDSFGDCTLSSRMAAGFIWFFGPIALIVLSLTMIVVGAIKSRRK